MSKISRKSPKIAALIAHRQGGDWPAQYLGFFDCFNEGLFYEAHDVLEELWLAGGRAADDYSFHKGLIQLAGAFVHLQKDRLRPAAALFTMAEANLGRYPSPHNASNLTAILELLREWRDAVEAGDFQFNPLAARKAPRLEMPGC